METLRVQFPVNTYFSDERRGEDEYLPEGSVKELSMDVALPVLLRANPAPRLLSPIKLRSGFIVHWRDPARGPVEGRLLLQICRESNDGIQEWLLVEESGQARLIRRGQLLGWDPSPFVEAARAVHRDAESEQVASIAEQILRAVIETPDDGTDYRAIG